MSRRNVWLTFDEWNLINKELSDQKYHSFQLSAKQVNQWKDDMKRYSFYENRKFERVGIYPEVEEVKSPRALNILCREGWRPQDMYYVMKSSYDFIGFIINHCDDVNMDTTLEEWENIRNRMNDVIDKSDNNIWFEHDLIGLYRSLSDTLSYANHNG
jgi:hypothetical protein